MALEALFNQKIPEDINLNHDGNSLLKQDIEWKEFKEKYRHILPIITGVNIYNDYLEDYNNIIRLNSLRK